MNGVQNKKTTALMPIIAPMLAKTPFCQFEKSVCHHRTVFDRGVITLVVGWFVDVQRSPTQNTHVFLVVTEAKLTRRIPILTKKRKRKQKHLRKSPFACNLTDLFVSEEKKLVDNKSVRRDTVTSERWPAQLALVVQLLIARDYLNLINSERLNGRPH